MIVVRDIFHLQFGKARDAIALWKENAELSRKAGTPFGRVLTDRVGRYYTMVLETEYESLAAYEATEKRVLALPEFRKWYAKFVPLVESGEREVLNVVDLG